MRFIMILFTSANFGFAQSIFQKTYGTSNYEEVWGMDLTNDGGFVLSGYTNFTDGLIIKLSSFGDTMWTKTLNAGGTDLLYSIAQTSDNGYIAAGRTSGFGAGGLDVFIVRLNSSGTVAWTKAIGGTGDETANAIKQTTDGGYIIAGNTYSFGAGSNDFYIIKTDINGAILWTRTIGGSSNDNAYALTQTPDLGYLVLGLTASTGAGSNDILAVKLDSSGNVTWQKTYGSTGDDRANSISITSDSNYIISGVTDSYGAGNYDFYCIKIDGNGTLLWEKTFGGPFNDWSYSVSETSDYGLLFSGYTTNLATNADYYLVRTDSIGDTLWTKAIGGPSQDYATLTRETSDNGYATIGYSQSFGAGNYDFYLTKLNSAGNGLCQQHPTNTILSSPTSTLLISALTASTGGLSNSTTPVITYGTIPSTLCSNVGINQYEDLMDEINVYPNPATDRLVIETSNGEVITRLNVVDVLGKTVSSEMLNAVGRHELNTSSLSPGMYFVEVMNANGMKGLKKFSKQ